MPLEMIFTDTGALILFVLLILAFVVAFKIMEMVFETILVSIISGAFYVSMVYLFGFSFSAERIILFAFLGASLYMLFSFLSTMYAIASTLLSIPYKVLVALLIVPKYFFRELYSYVSSGYRGWRNKENEDVDKETNSSEEDRKGRDVKEVVMDKVGDKEDEE